MEIQIKAGNDILFRDIFLYGMDFTAYYRTDFYFLEKMINPK